MKSELTSNLTPTLDFRSKKYIKAIYAKGYSNISNMTVEEVRQNFGCFENDSSFSNIKIDDKSYSYKIFKSPVKGNNLIIYLHGGAYVLRHDKHNNKICSELSNKLNFNVLLLHYSLAPENKFPTAINEVTKFIKNIDKIKNKFPDIKNIYILGDSSGGNLAVSSLLNLKEFDVKGLILISPSLDYCTKYESKNYFGSCYLLDTHVRKWFASCYLNNESERKNALISPILSSNLNILPRTLIINSYFDPMRDESILFNKLLKRNNVDSELHTLSTIHNFFHLQITPYFSDSIKLINDFLK
tara:strand:+ start:3849 stop:4748 length:900 start_codon:yes stop_codon:yes gene_type:complete